MLEVGDDRFLGLDLRIECDRQDLANESRCRTPHPGNVSHPLLKLLRDSLTRIALDAKGAPTNRRSKLLAVLVDNATQINLTEQAGIIIDVQTIAGRVLLDPKNSAMIG